MSLMTFSCMKVNDPTSSTGYKNVMTTMSEIECWEKEHLFLIFSYALPTLFCYVLGIPVLFIFFIAKYYK